MKQRNQQSNVTAYPLLHLLQMAEALARGFVSKGVTSADKMYCFDPSEERKQVFKEFGVTPCANSKDVVSSGRLIFIAVKPQYVKTVLEEVKGQLTDEHVIVSIAAGVPLAVLEVRQPCLIARGGIDAS